MGLCWCPEQARRRLLFGEGLQQLACALLRVDDQSSALLEVAAGHAGCVAEVGQRGLGVASSQAS